MPTPNEGETKEEFLERCMGDAEAMEDFPDTDQRYAFCESQWENKNMSKSRIERRFLPTDAELRDEGNRLVGHAATFEQPYSLGVFDEVIDRGAFDDAIENDDVRALWNHDPNIVLGRTKSGTLKLSKDKHGLLSEIDLPKSAESQREAIERGDVDQMSFGFSVEEEKWEEREDDVDLRTILRAKLYDVSPVTFPANPNTDVALRSHEEWQKECEDAQEPSQGPPEELSAAAARVRAEERAETLLRAKEELAG